MQQQQQLNSRIHELEQQHQDYVHQQQNLISAIAEICVSPMQEIEALQILIYRGEGECRRERAIGVGQTKSGFKNDYRTNQKTHFK
ncbi:hypothetical protein [Nostoc sp. NMS8]|uniref:hypothetical protein n=1 Tax=Nostoc sp. NMS8 TaxID=2815392 RepID=UPI0025DBC500|nr:hypothetical protein [Nostoc sp. NMS8]MBN3962191.1 hypothetical protein [Nostoc sp. NMS8]